MTTQAQHYEETAAALGLTLVKAEGWAQYEIRNAAGVLLDVCGLGAIGPWLCGYRAAKKEGA